MHNKTNINYLNDSSKMVKEIKSRMKKGSHENKPYEKTDHKINKDSSGSALRHMTSENFLNRNKAPLRDQLKSEDNNIWKSNKKYKKVHMEDVGKSRKKELDNEMIAGNWVRGEDIEVRPHVAGDRINITVPQDEHNKTIRPITHADIIITPYNVDRYTRIGNLLQRNQSDLQSANRLLMTQPFARHYVERRNKGLDHLTAYKETINEEIQHHSRKDHDMFNPYLENGDVNIGNQHFSVEKKITDDIKPNGQPGKEITNLSRIDIAKLQQIAKMLSPSEGIKNTQSGIMGDISGVV